jgi:hypothetical protein
MTPIRVYSVPMSNTLIDCLIKSLMLWKLVCPTLPEESITKTTSATFDKQVSLDDDVGVADALKGFVWIVVKAEAVPGGDGGAAVPVDGP